MSLFCRSWPLCCLFFIDIRIMIPPLVSSNCSWRGNQYPYIEDEQTIQLSNYTAYLSTGNDNIHTLTSQASYKLRIDIEDFSGDARYVVYDVFKVGDEASQYLLDIDGYSGNVCKIFNSI